jgi:LysM repeat protein
MYRRSIAVVVFAVFMIALVPLTVSASTRVADDNTTAPQADGPNLLANPGLEGKYRQQCSLKTDPPWVPAPYPCDPYDYDTNSLYLWATAQVPEGWAAWWRVPNGNESDRNFFNTFPNNCPQKPSTPPTCVPWHNPEFRDTAGGPQETGPSRRLAGENSQKYFTYYSIHEAGLYQMVGGIKPGQRLRFSVYMEAWSSAENDPFHSVGQPTMGMKVGIDPYGGNNPWSPNIVWSPVQESFDQFSLFSVEAVARNSVVSVWTRSQPFFALQHNDVYVDEASLVVVGNTPARASRSTTKPTVCTSTSTTVLLIPTGLLSITRIITSTKVVPCVTTPTTPITLTRPIGSASSITTTRTTTSTVTAARPVSGVLPIPASGTYTVVRGDTLSAIAKRYGIPWLKLAELNDLEPPYKIEVGQVLRLK